MIQLEVRCCCQPQKVLGSLPVPDGVQDGDSVRYGTGYEIVVLPVGTICDVKAIALYPDHRNPDDYSRDSHLALKSEETPIETLRLIRGFKEAPAQA